MRLSQFNELMNDEFGAEYAAILVRDLALTDLSDRTPERCLADGEDPKDVWLAICAANSVPKDRWHGRDKKNKKPN